MAKKADVIVVGGGMIGTAISFGLARAGASVALLDEGDDALRAARGNFGLVWVQSKGLGMQRYADWTKESAALWTDFAAEMGERTGIDVGHSKPGGLQLCLGDQEMEERRRFIDRMRQQGGPERVTTEMIDRQQVEALLPGITLGPEVSGGSFCPEDGHANPLFLLRAMMQAMQDLGGQYHPNCRVERLKKSGSGFTAETSGGIFKAPRVVVTAGLGAKTLGGEIGLDCPVEPERGQVLVTERTAPFIPLPMSQIRQSVEGSVLLGDSKEDVGYDTGTTAAAGQAIASRAVRKIPALAGLRMVRTWGALRVMSPDGKPIYHQSESCPGAFVATAHSGVTLAAIHAARMPDWILNGQEPDGFEAFHPRRFSDGSKISSRH